MIWLEIEKFVYVIKQLYQNFLTILCTNNLRSFRLRSMETRSTVEINNFTFQKHYENLCLVTDERAKFHFLMRIMDLPKGQKIN